MIDDLVVDPSAFVAIVQREPEADAFAAKIRSHSTRVMSAAGYLECAMVASRWRNGREDLDAWLTRESIDVVEIDHTLARAAADAFERYDKGRHPAGLNFGDCFSYALAQARSAPLLFKGDDFVRTDVRRPPP